MEAGTNGLSQRQTYVLDCWLAVCDVHRRWVVHAVGGEFLFLLDSASKGTIQDSFRVAPHRLNAKNKQAQRH